MWLDWLIVIPIVLTVLCCLVESGSDNSVVTRCFYYLGYFVLWLISVASWVCGFGFDLLVNYCKLVITTVFAVCFLVLVLFCCYGLVL